MGNLYVFLNTFTIFVKMITSKTEYGDKLTDYSDPIEYRTVEPDAATCVGGWMKRRCPDFAFTYRNR